MKKFLIVVAVIFIIFLMVSNATAVPQTYGKTIMKNISNTKQQISLLEERLALNNEKLNNIITSVQPNGLFENLINLIKFLINIISSIINFILTIMEIGQLLINLINLVKTFIDVLTQFIEWLQDLFNPESNTVVVQ